LVHSPALAAYVGVLDADHHHFGVIAVAAVAEMLIEAMPLEPDESGIGAFWWARRWNASPSIIGRCFLCWRACRGTGDC